MRKVILVACILITMGVKAEAVGLAMRFSDVTLENVPPGTFMNLRTDKNLPMVILNQDDSAPVDVVIEAVSPEAGELKDSYEPIPDPNWIRAVPNRFHLGPKASAATDVILQIPNDPKLIGRHFEVILWVHSDPKKDLLPNGGVLFQVGLRSRFRISVGTPGPEALQREKLLKKLATINTNFSINPDTLYVADLPMGKMIDLKAEKRASFKVVNQGDESVALRFKSVPADPNISPQAGYENAPDPKWLEILTPAMSIPGNSVKEIKTRVHIPDDAKYRGKKYMFLILTTLSDDSLPLEYHNMLYVAVNP
jgi:hypothetical protein